MVCARLPIANPHGKVRTGYSQTHSSFYGTRDRGQLLNRSLNKANCPQNLFRIVWPFIDWYRYRYSYRRNDEHTESFRWPTLLLGIWAKQTWRLGFDYMSEPIIGFTGTSNVRKHERKRSCPADKTWCSRTMVDAGYTIKYLLDFGRADADYEIRTRKRRAPTASDSWFPAACNVMLSVIIQAYQ